MTTIQSNIEEVQRRLLTEICGGDDVVIAMGHRLRGETWKTIADRLQIPKSTLYRRVRAAKSKLDRCGLLSDETFRKL